MITIRRTHSTFTARYEKMITSFIPDFTKVLFLILSLLSVQTDNLTRVLIFHRNNRDVVRSWAIDRFAKIRGAKYGGNQGRR